jgi:hypothetical protein
MVKTGSKHVCLARTDTILPGTYTKTMIIQLLVPVCPILSFIHSFWKSVLRQVHSLFQSKFAIECVLVLCFQFPVSSLSLKVIQ